MVTTGTVVKPRSLLGEGVTRQGSAIHVAGAAKGDAGDGDHLARPGVRVGIDRYAGNDRHVRPAAVTTDRLGHLDVTVRIPYRVGIRLTTADSGEVFGAVTPALPV